ncbi:ESPR-type extended signal peptide-containing protein [Stenotrophomonas sp. TWI809]|uniref:ESPR-type extended signal peptide-containing protein n=1 Tax=Stenotrophomonas sp. TWI809 TaxID=3136796 RepID=UPI003207C357
MNRIYRRLWNRTRQRWVVVSELAHGCAGSAGARRLNRHYAFALLMPLVASAQDHTEQDTAWWHDHSPHALHSIFADAASNAIDTKALRVLRRDVVAYTTAADWNVTSGAESMAVGPEARASGTESLAVGIRTQALGQNTVAVGNAAEAAGANSVAVGKSAEARGTHSVAVGYSAAADTGGYSVALGTFANAQGIGAVALGHDAKASSLNSIAIGSGADTVASAAGSSRIAIGGNASAGSAGYTGAVALGGNAKADYNGVALGHAAKATAVGSVAIGVNSEATESNSVSVGSSGNRRRIVNVADARLTSASTDAVTGKQLYATNMRIDAVGNMVTQTSAASELRVGKENTGSAVNFKNRNGAVRYLNGIRNGTLSTSSTDAVTGQQLFATNQQIEAATARLNAAAVAIGQSAAAEGSGTTASMAVGSSAKAYNANSVALGADARAGVDVNGDKSTAGGSIAIGARSRSGNGALAAGLRASAIGDRAVALGNDASAASIHSTAVGHNASATAGQATAVGREASASGTYAVALGNLAKASAGSAVALGDRAVAAHTGSVALGSGSQSTAANQVSVGSTTVKRKIVNVADGALNTSSTEAVTGKQLNATNVEVASVRTTATSAQTAATAARTAADSALTKANVLGGLVSQVSATGNVRLGGENTGAVLDVRNKSNASRKVTGVADAALSASSTEAVSGKQLNATNVEVASVRTTATSAQTTANAAKTTADSALSKADVLGGLVSQVSVTGNVRLGGENTGAVLDVRNKSNASRKVTGVADATLSASSAEAVTGKQLNATNVEVASVRTTATSAQITANAAKTTADNALAKADVLGGLVSQVSATGNVRLGGENTGTVLDVRNKSNANRKLTGVADAALNTSSTEAVTGRQLFGVDQKVTANQSLLASHATELAGHEARIADNRRDLDDLRTEFDNFDPDLEGVVRYAADGSVDMDGGKVRGVAAGDISSAGSTDAVNGGQLFATNQRLSQVEGTARYIAIGYDDESIDAKAGEFSVAIGDGAEAGEGTDGATAIGAFSRARGKGSVALGRASFVDSSAENGFALGTGSSVHSNEGVALGGFARIESGAEYSVALGASSTATEENVVSVGNLTRKRRIVNLARGRGAEDAVTVGQLGDSLAALGGGAGIDPGGNIILPTYKIQGGSQNNVEDALNVLDGAVVAGKNRADLIENQLRSVFQDSPATRSDGLGQLNLAGANGMVLGNVANGLIAPGSRDAVNGGQLHAMEQRLDGRIDGLEQRVDATPEGRALASASAPTAPVAPEAEGPAGASGEPAAASAGRAGGGIASADGGGSPAPADAPAPTPQVNTADLEKMLARANEYTDGAISNFERRLDKMDKRFNRMAAMSSAQSAMAMNTAGLATYNRLGAGVGYSEGESALAVGYQRVLNERGSATFSLNGAFTNSGEQSVGLGVGIGW